MIKPKDPPEKLITSLTNHSPKPKQNKIINRFLFGSLIKNFIKLFLLIFIKIEPLFLNHISAISYGKKAYYKTL